MAKNQTYKAFTVRPTHVMDLNGVLLETAPIMAELAAEVRGISGYATYVVRNDTKLAEKLAQVGTVPPAVAGQRAGVTMPWFFVKDEKGKPIVGKSGKSRKEMLI